MGLELGWIGLGVGLWELGTKGLGTKASMFRGGPAKFRGGPAKFRVGLDIFGGGPASKQARKDRKVRGWVAQPAICMAQPAIWWWPTGF